jgi:hypothetical protein
MRKLALFVALAMIAASPAMAAQKKSKRAPAQPAMTDAQKANDNSYRFVRDSLPMWLPSWAQPIYQGMKKNEAAADVKPAKRKSKSKTKTS